MQIMEPTADIWESNKQNYLRKTFVDLTSTEKTTFTKTSFTGCQMNPGKVQIVGKLDGNWIKWKDGEKDLVGMKVFLDIYPFLYCFVS